MVSFKADKNGRLSKLAIIKFNNLSYSAVRKALRNKDVKVNGKRVKDDVSLSVGDTVELYVELTAPSFYSVLYEDANVVVINKKSGVTSEEIFELLKKEYSDVRFIHRLDRNTSGIMIFALNPTAGQELLAGFKARTFNKVYYAEVFGFMPDSAGEYNAFLVKDSAAATVKVTDAPTKGALPIRTGYRVIKEKDLTSVLEVTLYTGRTHQIRAQLAHAGHFVVGDGKYGNNVFNRAHGFKSQKLVAGKLTLNFREESPLYYLNGRTFTVDCDF